MDIPSDVKKGQAVYSKSVLSIYDYWVLGVSNNHIWKCPSSIIETHFNRNISSNHLDIGVGTGYFLDHCRFPATKPRVALMDLNQNSLDEAAKRIARYNPETYQRNALEKIDQDIPTFDSISVNYLLHCLPGKLSEKLTVLENVDDLLNKKGKVFGSTILSKGVDRSFAAMGLMALYNFKGIFSNSQDSLEDLETYLSTHYSCHEIAVEGCVALFSAKK